METPLVSVCMTAYNHEAYIAQAIEGVLMQRTSFPVELVIGEDCSTDSTAAICQEYATRYPTRIRIVTAAQNVGWRANYRRTIAACRGRYVAICDGDDWWSSPDKLQMQADLLESEATCGMCYTRSERFDQESGARELYPQDEAYEDFDRMLFKNTVENCTAMARRELIERYYQEVRPELHPEWLTDDACMWIWFAANVPFRFIEATTAVHRVLPFSVSHSTDYRKKIAFCDSLSEISLWFDCHYGTGRHRQQLLRRKHAVALWVLSYNGSCGEYLARWWTEITAHPQLLFNLTGYGLFIKKILFRRRKS